MTGLARSMARPRSPWTERLWPVSVLARRKPLLFLRLSALFLLRLAERMFCGLLFHEPPRRMRLPARISRTGASL
jgi:hypothetical protein